MSSGAEGAGAGGLGHAVSGIAISDAGAHQRHNSQQHPSSVSNHSFMSRFTAGSPSKSSLGLGAVSPIHLAESGRRPSGNMSRMASFYGSVSSGSPDMNKFGIVPDYNEGGAYNSYVQRDSQSERTYFQALNEILACDRSWETPNLIAIATPRNLQLLKVSESDVSLQTELIMKPAGRAKFSTISDLSFGHQQFGRYLAASTITGAINIYHFDRGTRAKVTLQGHKRAVNSISFNSMAPHILASGSQDGKIMIWDLKASNSKPSMTLSCNADAVRCCSFNNKKGHALAAVFDSGVVEKWDLRKNTTWERRINAHTGPALTVHWHPELDYIVTGGRDRQLQVWNMMDLDHREPAHVIYTSGPIAKARWCKGRGNNSIMNTDIAVSFFNDDPTVQIWNLNRKWIPKHVINAHSAPVTQLIWRTPKHLISTSKDKTLVQCDITKESEFSQNVPSAAMTWNPTDSADFVVIRQDRGQFQGPFVNVPRQTQSQPQLVHEQSSIAEDMDLRVNASLTSPQETSGMQFYENSVSEMNSSPPSAAMRQRHPLGSRQASYISAGPNSIPNIGQSSATISSVSPPPAWVTPVHVPLPMSDVAKAKFLSTNYLLRVPAGGDIVEVCEYNSMLAASVGFFRDCQTWRAIKMAIVLDEERKEEIAIGGKLEQFQFDRDGGGGDRGDRDQHDGKGVGEENLGTSYGSESDVMKKSVRSTGSESFASEEFSRRREVTITQEVDNETAVVDDDEEEEEEEEEGEEGEEHEAEGDANAKGDVALHVTATATVPVPVSVPIDIKPEKQGKSVSSSLSKSHPRSNRFSFTGSSVDLDDEKSGSPTMSLPRSLSLLSLSASPSSMRKSRSRLLMTLRSEAVDGDDIAGGGGGIGGVSRSVDTRLSKTSDGRSQLTAIMRENTKTEADTETGAALDVPWNPRDMIREAAQYSCEQGDLVMCTTLALLFAERYPGSVSTAVAEEWVQRYHEYLLRCGFFCNAATVLRLAAERFDALRTVGQTRTAVRTLCGDCGRPLLKELWHCTRCRRRQGACSYCGEPVRGGAVALACGHGGHFGCLRTWFLEEGERRCPACGDAVDGV